MGFSIASLVASSAMLAPEPPAGIQFFSDGGDSAENKCPQLASLFSQITHWRNCFANPFKIRGVAAKSPEWDLMKKMVEVTKKLHKGRIAIELAIERGFNIHGARAVVGELVSAGREYDHALRSYPMNNLLNQACDNVDLRRIFGGCYLTQEAVTFYDYPDSGLGTGAHNSNLSGYRKVVAGHRIEWFWKNDVKGRKMLVGTSLELLFQNSMTALQNKPDRVVPVMTTFVYDHKLKMAFQCAEMIFLTLHAYQLSQIPSVHTGEHDQLIRGHFDQFLAGIRSDPSAWEKWASDFTQALT